jgi:hypothetical protein
MTIGSGMISISRSVNPALRQLLRNQSLTYADQHIDGTFSRHTSGTGVRHRVNDAADQAKTVVSMKSTAWCVTEIKSCVAGLGRAVWYRGIMSRISLQDDIDDRRFEDGAAVTGEYSYSTAPRVRTWRPATSPEYAIGDVLWLDIEFAIVVRTRPKVRIVFTLDALDNALDRLQPWHRFVRREWNILRMDRQR